MNGFFSFSWGGGSTLSCTFFFFHPPLPSLLAHCWHSMSMEAHNTYFLSTSCSEYIGLHWINFQYGRVTWNNRPLVESRCQNESGTSFLKTTGFPARTQLCVDAADRWQRKGKVQHFVLLLQWDEHSRCAVFNLELIHEVISLAVSS